MCLKGVVLGSFPSYETPAEMRKRFSWNSNRIKEQTLPELQKLNLQGENTFISANGGAYIPVGGRKNLAIVLAASVLDLCETDVKRLSTEHVWEKQFVPLFLKYLQERLNCSSELCRAITSILNGKNAQGIITWQAEWESEIPAFVHKQIDSILNDGFVVVDQSVNDMKSKVM